MTTAGEMKDRILNRSTEVGESCTRLIAGPKAAIAAETGATIPDGFDLAVNKDSVTTAHPVPSPSPKLTEAEVKRVFGGVFIWFYVYAACSTIVPA